MYLHLDVELMSLSKKTLLKKKDLLKNHLTRSMFLEKGP